MRWLPPYPPHPVHVLAAAIAGIMTGTLTPSVRMAQGWSVIVYFTVLLVPYFGVRGAQRLSAWRHERRARPVPLPRAAVVSRRGTK